jgi:hypothetical protein
MKLYIFNYWLPFPKSEYGGLIAITANDIKECIDIARQLDYDNTQTVDDDIKREILSGEVFELKHNTTARIVDAFIT